MASTMENDAEDVNDFLRRIQELGAKRDQEDEERNRKLEEEILQARKERQARRAERARSISPRKNITIESPRSSISATTSPAIASSTFTSLPSIAPKPAHLEEVVKQTTSKPIATMPLSPSLNINKMSPSSAMPTRSGTVSWQRRPGSAASTPKIGSLPMSDAQRLPHPSSIASSDVSEAFERPKQMAMSPAQGRISPDRMDRMDRMDRPVSPTKGLGGFVQSAMMKRSDSVNKRWSVKAPEGLSRSDSVLSHRASQDMSKTHDSLLSGVSRESTPMTISRPNSSHSSLDAKPQPRPLPQPPSAADTKDGSQSPPLPISPSKTYDTRRWSPTKSSWLESALKAESPKPKQATPAKPSWMSEITKAKEKNLAAVEAHVSVAKPEVTPVRTVMANRGTNAGTAVTATPPSKSKPQTPPKKDFRSSLKPKEVSESDAPKPEPEFKSALGQLRRTKTQKYQAPDVLKDNILRGKAGLVITDGPQKSERKDEFKEAILEKKQAFQKAKAEGTAVVKNQPSAEKEVPEALKKAALVRSQTLGAIKPPPKPEILSPTQSRTRITSTLDRTPLLKMETSAPARLQGRPSNSKLAERFNPALASILVRGPPSKSPTAPEHVTSISNTSSISTPKPESKNAGPAGPQLSHMTKGRARGPKRKAPSSLKVQAAPADPEAKIEKSPPKLTSSLSTETKFPRSAASTPKPNFASKPVDEPLPEPATPTSPKKLDVKRRSQFLVEASSNEIRNMSNVSTPGKYGGLKSFGNSPAVAKAEKAIATPERKFTPTPKPKPTTLASSPVTSRPM